MSAAELHALSLNSIEPPLSWLEEIAEDDRGFWNWRPSLRAIYDAALARMTSPWAVFAHCVAKALAIVPPSITLPPLVGSLGSLNWFGIIIDQSGGGKGAAAAVARELTARRCAAIPVRNLGSGEGIIAAYQVPGDKANDVPPGWRESVHFDAAEIDAMTAQVGRSGSTLMPVLRDAFSGGMLGASTIRSDGLHLEAHSYRLVLTVSAQPGRCAGLLGDADGGTPQRFMWFPANDVRIRAHLQSSAPLHELPLPGATAWPFRHSVTVPPFASDVILQARERRMRAEVDESGGPLDGHALFVREKVAYALAVLDGRVEMSDDDWMLSQFAADVSEITRAHVQEQIEVAEAVAAARLGKLQAVSGLARKGETYRREEMRVQRHAQRIIKYLSDGKELSRNGLMMKFGSHERAWVDQALQSLLINRLIEAGTEGGYRTKERG